MKKTLLLFAAIFLFSGISFGQMTLGFRLGYNASKLTTDVNSISTDFKSGFHAGVFTRFGKRIYFAPELLYTFSGSSLTSSSPDSAWHQTIRIGSVDVPLLFGLNIIRSQMIKWRVELGPVMSFVTNKKVEDVNSFTGPIETADINTAQWMIMAGTGIDIWFITLDIRYEYAFNTLIADVQDYSFDTKNNLLVVSLGFKFLGNQKNK
jgi:hypothetical protein